MLKSFPKIDITFAQAWWHKYYRAELERGVSRERLLYDRFGDVGLGQAEPTDEPPVVGDEYGDRFMAAFWGCEVVCQPGHAPAAIPLPNAMARMENLEVPDLASSPLVIRTLEKAEQLKAQHGRCRSGVSIGGPMNTAVSVFGDELLHVCAAEPDLARHVHQKMAEAIVAIHDHVVCVIEDTDVAEAHRRIWGVGNCPVCMISPQMYIDVVRPADLWLKEQFPVDGFSVHHCGLFHPYVEAYRPLAPTVLDVGPGTDLRITRAAYPQAKMSTFLEVAGAAKMSPDEMDAVVTKMIEDAAPIELFTRIRIADAGPEVSDETVRNWVTVPQRLSR